MAIKFDRRPTFTLTQEDEATLIEAARQQGCSKSKLIRELIRGNLSMPKSPEAVNRQPKARSLHERSGLSMQKSPEAA